LEYQAKKLLDSLQDTEGNIREMQKEELPNIAMADTFMSIFGYKRVKPTNEELKLKYRKRDIDKGVHELDELQYKR
jgi:hypothetical protein